MVSIYLLYKTCILEYTLIPDTYVYIIIYVGSKVGYTFIPGYPAIRVQIARKFMECKGFTIVSNLLERDDFLWPGGDQLLIILKIITVSEVRS